jgi:hypothetical protein
LLKLSSNKLLAYQWSLKLGIEGMLYFYREKIVLFKLRINKPFPA